MSDRLESTTPEPGTTETPAKTKRSWRSRLLELAFWALVAVGVALAMIYFADKLLPNNF